MGVPVFQIRDLVKEHGIEVFSSNYVLYADMSNRVMTLLRQFAPDQEVYSIDESFLELTGLPNIAELMQTMREQVKRDTGIRSLRGCRSIQNPCEARELRCKAAPKIKRRVQLQHTHIATNEQRFTQYPN